MARFFKISLITLFFLGAIGINIVQAAPATLFIGDGKAKGTEKGKINLVISVSVDTSSFPSITATIFIPSTGETFSMDGKALARNLRKGHFQMFGKNGYDDMVMAMSGIYKVNAAGSLTQIGGRFQLLDNFHNCIATGRFKAK